MDDGCCNHWFWRHTVCHEKTELDAGGFLMIFEIKVKETKNGKVLDRIEAENLYKLIKNMEEKYGGDY